MRNSIPPTSSERNVTPRGKLGTFITAISFWKPIERVVLPSKEQLAKERSETHAAIQSSNVAIQESRELLNTLSR